MKAAYIEQTGPADNIIYGDLPKPEATGSQVLVKTGAVAVNPVDTYIRNGANYWELPKPFVIGCDLAGTVEAVGPQVTHFKVGDRVWCTNQGLMGDDVTHETAAACALVGVTAHLGLFRDAALQAGESIFVHGGTGGVGSMVVQMAKAAGARVITTGGSDEKCARAKELGADVAVNYKTQDVAAAIKEFAPKGVNVVWETLREPDLDALISYLAERGRLILMAGRDARPPFPVGPFYVKGCSLHGVVMFKATADELRACSVDMNRWMSAGKLKAQIGKTLPLAEAAAAHRLQEENTLQKSGTLAGKIVLKP